MSSSEAARPALFARRPALGVAACFCAGTWLGLTVAVPPLLLLSALLAFLLSALGLGARPRGPRGRAAGSLLTCLAIVSCAWLAALLRAPAETPGPLLPPRDVPVSGTEIIGVVLSDPDVIPRPKGGVTARFPFRVEQVRRGNGPWQAADIRLNVTVYASAAATLPDYGERWRMAGSLDLGRSRSAAPDRLVSLRQTLYFRAGLSDARLLSAGNGWWFAEKCHAARRIAAGYLAAGIGDHPDIVNILDSLLLGYRHLDKRLQEVFVFTGTLHIFAISGSHVVVMAGFIVFILRLVRIPSVYWALFLAPLLSAYTLATGLQASSVRACLMAILFWAAPLVGRKADVLSALAVSAVLILAVSPVQLFSTGFILSYVVVIGLIVLYPVIYAPMERWLEPDPFRLQPEPRRVQWLRAGGRAAASVLAVSIAAWLTSLPLTAYYFGNFTPVTVFCNLLVVPVSTLVILTGCLSLLFGSCVLGLAAVFNHANLALVRLLVESMEVVAALPFANLKLDPVPAAWTVWAWYALLGLWLLTRRPRPSEPPPAGATGPQAASV